MQVGFFRLCGHCAVEGSILNVITCIYACAPPFPGGSHVVVLNVAVRNLEKFWKNVEHIDRVPVSLGYSLCYPVNLGTLVKLGRPADEPPVVCRYKFQQVLTSRPRMCSLVLLKRGGPYSFLSNGFLYIMGSVYLVCDGVNYNGPATMVEIRVPHRDDLTYKSGV